jgi:acyl-CoA reductase-like NAD-dependent aldehyde dehydrogenase
MRESASTVKRVSLELGGNAPFIVFDDADLDVAVQALMFAKFRNAGQACIAANRVLVQEGVYQKFADKLAEKVKSNLVCGHGTDAKATVGPLINKAGLDKSVRHVKDALGKGAIAVAGGSASNALNSKGGSFYEPTVLTNVTRDMQVFSEETFGPVCPLMSFKTEEEAISIANDTRSEILSVVFR